MWLADQPARGSTHSVATLKDNSSGRHLPYPPRLFHQPFKLFPPLPDRINQPLSPIQYAAPEFGLARAFAPAVQCSLNLSPRPPAYQQPEHEKVNREKTGRFEKVLNTED